MPPITKERYDLFCKYLWKMYGSKRMMISEGELQNILAQGLGVNSRRKVTWEHHLGKLLDGGILVKVEEKTGVLYRVCDPMKKTDFCEHMKSIVGSP